MKTKKTLIISLIVVCTALFFSCDIPLALGTRLDIEGPLVNFTAPAPRKAVSEEFVLEGNVSDNSPIKEMLIKPSINNVDYAKQWRYTRIAGWQVTENYGSTWTEYTGAQWNGDEKSAEWVLPVDLSIGGVNPQDGEYMFVVQAWDTGGFSDDNSFKTLVLIYDKDPPKVEVYNPFLYDKYQYDGSVFKGDLFTLADAGTWKEPSLLGKFLTQEFLLQWQIEDQHDIWSIELLFYEHDADIDGFVETEVPDDYIYYYHENLPPPDLDPTKNIKPNGSVLVPDLGGEAKQYNGGDYKGGTINKTLDDKTIIKVVSRCFDAAGWVNQEKVLGYFVFWPQAAQPWITYTEGMEKPSEYIDNVRDEAYFNQNAFMIYPGRNIRATAFQTQGVSRVEFTIHSFTYSVPTTSWTIGEPMDLSYMRLREGGGNIEYANSQNTRVVVRNPPRPNGTYSTIFPWDFIPLARSANYVVRAQAYDSNGKPSEDYEAAFRVQDITFPDFPTLPQPPAGEPLFKFIGRPEAEDKPDNVPQNSIRISGVVADATEVESLYMVWINPESKNYAAMSQLSYFRDAGYAGWMRAIDAPSNQAWPMNESLYDDAHPNKLWKIEIDPATKREDPDTQRIWYDYSLIINLSTLNIGMDIGEQPLISQVFLLRAENPDKKSTIITYAPQGDTISPTLTIDKVSIQAGTSSRDYTPGEFAQVSKFTGNEKITVEGRWTEDSTEFLNNKTYFYDNMSFTINNIPITGQTGSATTVVKTPTDPTAAVTEGTFILTADVGENSGTVKTTDLRDTLVVNAKASDIGGNPWEAGASWLIESDTLRFLRISSEREDDAYKEPSQIEIFLEFNKPVRLKPGRGQDPVLVLNPTGGNTPARAYYNAGQTSESTRHFFTYTVAAGQNTPTNQNLNVSGISIVGGTTPANNTPLAIGANDWQNANYPFTFVHTNIEGLEEEIRLTTDTAHRDPLTGNGVLRNVTGQSEQVWARVVPVTTTSTDGDYIFTLIGGKRISIDNTPPTITGITASPTGWHKSGVDIYITATFNKNVRKGAQLPRLTLTGGGQTTAVDDDIRVNNKQITFRYRVGAGDTTGTSPLQVTGFTGQILDIPGTAMTTLATTTLTGVYLDNTPPPMPQVAVFSGTSPNGTQINSPPATLYNNNVFIQVTAGTGSTAGDNANLGKLEYSLNNGVDWTSSTSATINYQLVNKGAYTILARQTDQAGNVTTTTSSVIFNWDPGSLITRISSTSPNGTYTHNSSFGNGNSIPITVYFRKKLNIPVSTSSITLNAVSGAAPGVPITVTRTIGTALTNVDELTFTYTIQNESPSGSNNGHRTPANQWLNVTGLNITVSDGATDVDAAFLTMPTSGSNLLLNENKQIKVETGDLIRTGNPTFIADNTAGTGWNVETNANYHGIRTDDGSYWTTLQIEFNHKINKGSGNITIEQEAGNNDNTRYRLPIVLTEAQYSRFKNDLPTIDTYYTKGTNGYIPGGIPITNSTSANSRSDTSAKYVLNYNIIPSNTLTGDAATFASNFRAAESINISVDAQAVTTSGSTLKIRLSGSNAPQVPGAAYIVRFPAGLVTDDLGNSSLSSDNDEEKVMASLHGVEVNLGGVARPFVRIRKTQEIIGNQTGSANLPRLYVVTQPYNAYVHIDGRTPGSTVQYTAANGTYRVTDSNWTTGAGPNNNNLAAGSSATISRPGTPATPFTAEITIGNTGEISGYKWWVVARSTKGVANSAESDEMAYRTAITYRLRANAANGSEMITPTNTTGQQRVGNGDQIWIRGGDAVGSSSIPGFPFTWEDNWTDLQTNNKRAGIRLMNSKGSNSTPTTTGTHSLLNSTWEFLTWDMNANAYVDFILGRDGTVNGGDVVIGETGNQVTHPASTVQQAWQYGPRLWAYQRGGWTSLKASYPIYPGEHRWLDIGQDLAGRGDINYSAAFNSRGTFTAYTGANQN